MRLEVMVAKRPNRQSRVVSGETNKGIEQQQKQQRIQITSCCSGA
jgi:hypothetical protein